jgi:16S rRNA (cytosine967-C5)-methyltransferase
MARGLRIMSVSPRRQASRPESKPSARSIAFSILIRVEREAAHASELLHARLDENVEPREAALATGLVMGTLRWQRLLDFLIERYAKRKTAALDREVLIALRMGIYQLRFLTRMPARAAVNESVELVRRARKSSAAALVNAALRRAASENVKSVAHLMPAEIDAGEKLGISHSHPTWLVERWLSRFGERGTVALLESNNREALHSCAFVNPARRDDAIRSLKESGIEFEAGRLLHEAVVVQRGNVAKTEAFRKGWVSFQDEASQMVPHLLGVKPGDSVLDLCAAPGGKTLALANLVGERGRVMAADVHETRLRAMRERMKKAGVANASLVALDGSQPLPFAMEFDRILVDAPCSGTGTLARNPEIRWRLREEDLKELHQRQVALVQSALAQLSPAGTLLYSTCSLEPEENELVMNEVLAANPHFRQEPVKIPRGILAAGVNASEVVGADGAFRTFPPMHHTDGFFAALIKRR